MIAAIVGGDKDRIYFSVNDRTKDGQIDASGFLDSDDPLFERFDKSKGTAEIPEGELLERLGVVDSHAD